MLSGLEAAGILRLPEAIAAEEEAPVGIGFARCRRNLEDREFLPSAFAQLALRFRASGEILSKCVQCGDSRLVLFPSLGHEIGARILLTHSVPASTICPSR